MLIFQGVWWAWSSPSFFAWTNPTSRGATIRDPAARPGDPNGARLRRGSGFSPSYRRKKGPGLFRVFVGDIYYPFMWGIITNHYKDPYETTSTINGKYVFFVFRGPPGDRGKDCERYFFGGVCFWLRLKRFASMYYQLDDERTCAMETWIHE